MNKAEVVAGVAKQTEWWVGQRRSKLKELSHDSMAINPFLAPLVMNMGDITTFDDLADFLLAGHFGVGHATGFGKLVDEKILPKVFGTVKLDKAYRVKAPYTKAVFDEIDHLVSDAKGKQHLLSVKASKWTIQLTMAVQLNRAFAELIELRNKKSYAFESIVVGVLYGKKEDLTDKYDILRGENRGAKHDVIDLTAHVRVLAGRSFWSWLNGEQDETQEWVMDGILQGFRAAVKGDNSLRKEIDAFRASYVSQFKPYVDKNGKIDWHGILKMVNG